MPPPQDTRRICGPDESVPAPLASSQTDDFAGVLPSADSKECKRHDGRALDAVRPMFLQCGTVSQANGSAYLEAGRTKVICSVYGPRETARRRDFQLTGQLSAEVKFTPYSCTRRRGHQQDSEENDMSRIVTQALEGAVLVETFPKAKVDVHVMVLEDGGGVLAAAMTAASAALADASIEMADMVTGVSMVFSGGTSLVDTDRREEEAACQDGRWATLTLAMMPTLGEVAAIQQRGHTSSADCAAAIRTAAEACLRVHQVQRKCLVDSLRSESAT